MIRNMSKFTITISYESTAKLDAICAESGYSRSEQIEGMILAESEERQPIPVLLDGRRIGELRSKTRLAAIVTSSSSLELAEVLRAQRERDKAQMLAPSLQLLHHLTRLVWEARKVETQPAAETLLGACIEELLTASEFSARDCAIEAAAIEGASAETKSLPGWFDRHGITA